MPNRSSRHRQTIFSLFNNNLAIDEIAGPQLVLFVIEFGLELDRAGRLINLDVNRMNLAATQRRNSVLGVGSDRQLVNPSDTLLRASSLAGTVMITEIG